MSENRKREWTDVREEEEEEEVKKGRITSREREEDIKKDD